jgi:hypothetical protein
MANPISHAFQRVNIGFDKLRHTSPRKIWRAVLVHVPWTRARYNARWLKLLRLSREIMKEYSQLECVDSATKTKLLPMLRTHVVVSRRTEIWIDSIVTNLSRVLALIFFHCISICS